MPTRQKGSLTKSEGEKVFPEVETKLTSFGLMSGFTFESSGGYAEVKIDQLELKRIIGALNDFVEGKFKDDKDYQNALKLVLSKISHKHHSFRIIADVVIGSHKVKFEHLSMQSEWPEE